MSLPEKTSVYAHLKQPGMVDFSGHVSAVFFVTGCNFGCGFCHNAGLMARRRAGLSPAKLRQALGRFREQWADAVVLSGGEPTLAPDLADLLKFFRDEGFAVKLDSNGSRPEVLERVLPLVDYVAMDVKCSLENYPGFVKFHQPENIRASVQLLKNGSVDYEFRTTVVESFHCDEQMHAIGELVSGARRYCLQPFLPREDLPDPGLRNEPRTSPDRMTRIGELMQPYADEVVVRGGTSKN